jgi:hypothetical protein
MGQPDASIVWTSRAMISACRACGRQYVRVGCACMDSYKVCCGLRGCKFERAPYMDYVMNMQAAGGDQ